MKITAKILAVTDFSSSYNPPLPPLTGGCNPVQENSKIFMKFAPPVAEEPEQMEPFN